MDRYLDLGSMLVILLTFVLFVVALFVKGMTHDLLLEAGVFLVSVKLIFASYASKRMEGHLSEKMDRILALIERGEGRS